MSSPSKHVHEHRAHAESHQGALHSLPGIVALATTPLAWRIRQRVTRHSCKHIKGGAFAGFPTHTVLSTLQQPLLQPASLDKPSPRFKLQPTFSPAKLRCAISLLQTITPGHSVSSDASGCCPTAAPVLRTQLVHQADLQAASFLLQHLAHWPPGLAP
jgi:hypothetical protein